MFVRLQIALYLMSVMIVISCVDAGKDDSGTEFAPNMYHAIPYEPLKQIKDKDAGNWVSSIDNGVGEYYSSNPNNPNGMNMRLPPPNTVKRNDYEFLPIRIPKDSLVLAAKVLKNPTDSTAAVVAEGKVLFGRYCRHCHGDTGQGDGLVGVRYKGVTAYTSRAVKDKPGGHIFHVITHGKGRMLSHGSQVGVIDRWKIVRYVQTLQQQ